MKNETKYAAPALDKGLDILEHLSFVGVPRSQVEIADALDRSATEIFRMLARLEMRGYIVRDPTSGKYQLSLKLYHLSHTHSPIDSLRRSALGPMQELVDQIGHPAHLCIIDRDALLVVCQVRSSSPVSLSIAEGSRFPIAYTTSGKLLLASLSEEDRSKIIEKDDVFNSWSKSKQDRFMKKLISISEQGYDFAESEITQGVTDIAARVGMPGSPILATVAVSSVSSNLGTSKKNHSELLKTTIETAKRISEINGLNS